MDFLPIFINIKDQKCLVIGGGKVATRKTLLLLQAGGRITVIAPRLDSTLVEQLQRGNITHCTESFHADHLDGA
ncbi:MAG: siroheme synthase, partial [Nitrosomonas sp.]|nr:siroheme synthase [Nitrosomonas sp.]